MKSWPSKALLLAGAALLAPIAFLPALGQDREAPESLLPPGFGDPQTLPPPEDRPPPPPPSPRLPPPGSTLPSPAAQETSELTEGEIPDAEALRPLNYFTIPEGTARPTDRIGILAPGNFGLTENGFGRFSGPYLTTLMHRLNAPLPSRWASILLRRALLSRVIAPVGMHPVDWIAARADLLLRMGEADAARLLVQSVDQENFTPRMVGVAARVALANSDPAGLCPLVEPADSDEAVWTLAEAICAALEGEPARAAELADEARRRGEASGIDFQLAEKVIGAGAQTRRAVTIEWDGVRQLNPWRVGLAGATGVEIPAPLLRGTEPHLQAWFARAPMIPLEQRLGAASMAASLGVLSSQSLVGIHSLIFDRTDPEEAVGTIGARLRTAWSDSDPADRMEAIRGLWRDADAPHERHARYILTAGAAARIPASEDFAADADELIASMLTAGMDRRAARWWPVVLESENMRAWAMLALAAPLADTSADGDLIDSFLEAEDNDARRRGQMFVAALAGLGRIDESDAASLAARNGFALGRADRWSRSIDRAARERAPATVVLLAAVGMQSGDWAGVPPSHLFRIVRALRLVGLGYEARMIAAEALARL